MATGGAEGRRDRARLQPRCGGWGPRPPHGAASGPGTVVDDGTAGSPGGPCRTGAGGSNHPRRRGAGMSEPARRTFEQLLEAMNRHDAAAAAELHAEDVLVWE